MSPPLLNITHPGTTEIDGILGSKLWAWGWAGPNAENLTLQSYGGGRFIITQVTDLSGNGRHWTNTTGVQQAGFRKGLNIPSGSKGGPWQTSFPFLSIDRFADGKEHYHNVYTQDNLNADAAFYAALVFVNTRTTGEREILGTDALNFLRIDQQRNALTICINGTAHKIAPNGTVRAGCQVIEVARTAALELVCAINGNIVGQTVLGGNWNIRGIGFDGIGTSQLDDYLCEVVLCRQLATNAERGRCLQRWFARWQPPR